MAFRLSLPKSRMPFGCLLSAIAMFMVCLVIGALFYIKLHGPLTEFPKSLRATIQIALADGGGGRVNLARVTRFPWSRAYFFEAWTRPEEIAACLGIDWKLTETISKRLEEDGRVGYVFMDGDNVVEFGWNLSATIELNFEDWKCPFATFEKPHIQVRIARITLSGKQRSVIAVSPGKAP